MIISVFQFESQRPLRKSTYTAEDLEKALQTVLTGQTNVKRAADTYRIPYETLRSNVKKRRIKFLPKNYDQMFFNI